MPVEVQEVTVRVGGLHGEDTVHTHPAFGQIAVSRSSGGHSTLYGSDFDHHTRMTIRISASELNRSLTHDMYFERGQYIEVDLSESQWATFVSSPNMGSGVPCTISRLMGKSLPALPPPTTRTKQFAGHLRDTIDKAMADLDEAVAFVDTLGLSAKKADALRAKIRAGGGRLRGTVPYLADRFDEHMEETVESAKTEVHGYMTGQIMRAGLASIGGDADAIVPLSLAGPEKDA